MVDWFPATPARDDWFGKDGVLPDEIVFFSQEDADEAGEPFWDTHEVEPLSNGIYMYIYVCIYIYIYIYTLKF